MSCTWAGSDQPRVIKGRHRDGCADDQCRGCQPCTEPHCRVCRMAHADGTCAECLASTRADLHEIARLCNSLPEEVEVRGIDGEAMMLLGPAADPEARGHLEASIACGRVPADYLETADHDRHPLFVLGSWDMLWRDALDHREVDALTLPGAVDYLDRQMTAMGANPHVPFEDFARDLRQCVSHLEGVLHDGEQVDEGVPCMTCGRRLTRTWGKPGHEDGWECKRCRTTSTEAQYQFAVKSDYIRNAAWLNAEDMTLRTGVSASTVRSWASEKKDRPTLIRKTLHSERTVYSVEDVQWINAVRQADERAA